MLYDLDGVKRTSSTEPTLLLVDTAGYVDYVLVEILSSHNCLIRRDMWNEVMAFSYENLYTIVLFIVVVF